MAVLRPSRGLIARRPLWFEPSTLDDGFDRTPSAITTATVAQRAAFTGWDDRQQQGRSNAQTWFDPGIGQERVPTIASAAKPRVDSDLSQDTQQLVDRTQRWYPRTDDDTDGPMPPPTSAIGPSPFAGVYQGADPSESRSTVQQVWAQPADLLGIREAPPDAPVEAQVSDQPDISGQQDRTLTARWFQPDTESFGDIPRANAPFDPTIFGGALHQQPDISEQRANGQRWHQPGDPVDGPLRASRYVNQNGPSGDAPGSYSSLVGQTAASYWRLGEPYVAPPQQQSGWGTSYDPQRGAGQNEEGTWVGGFTSGIPGAILGDSDTAYRLDGTAYMQAVPPGPIFNFGTTDFAVEAWFRDGGGTGGFLVSEWDEAGTSAGWTLAAFHGAVSFRVEDGATAAIAQYAAWLGDTPTRWHHLVGERVGSTVNLYFDGALVATAGGANLDVTNPASFFIGRRSEALGLVQAWDGDIDEVAIYTSALGPTAVSTHYVLATGVAPATYGQADISEQRANATRWFTPDLATEGLVPPVVTTFDPATGFPWLDDHQQDRGIQPTWFAPDAASSPESPIPTPTTATVAQQAGLWQDQSGQQDRSIQPVWRHPEDDWFAQFPSIPLVTPPTTDQLAGIWPEQPGQERGNGVTWYHPSTEPVDGPLQSWLFTVGSPGTGGVPAVLIDAETGKVYLSIGGNFIVPATDA